MSTKTTFALSVSAATAVLTVAIAPALIQSASVIPIPETQETMRCDNPLQIKLS